MKKIVWALSSYLIVAACATSSQSAAQSDVGTERTIELVPVISLDSPDMSQAELDSLIIKRYIDQSETIGQILTPEALQALEFAKVAIMEFANATGRKNVGNVDGYLIGFGSTDSAHKIYFLSRYVRNDIPYNDAMRERSGGNMSFFYGFSDPIPLSVTVSKPDMRVISVDLLVH